jgi:hypothetical protein
MFLADVLFLVIVVYLAYRFIFNFLLPIVKATNHFRHQFRDVRGDGNFGGGTRPGSGNESGGARQAAAGPGGEKRSHKPPAEDYIDFEEIK